MPNTPDNVRTGSFENLRDAIKIDKNDLDTCLVEQPDLFYRVSEAYTLARSLQDEIKTEITQLTSVLGAQFRAEAEENKEKITVDAVNQKIMGSPKMIDLQKEMLSASTKVGKWLALKEAYDMRSSSLKSLTQLFASNYFTVQTGARPRSEAVERGAENIRLQGGEERRNREPRLRPRTDD